MDNGTAERKAGGIISKNVGNYEKGAGRRKGVFKRRCELRIVGVVKKERMVAIMGLTGCGW